jgi:phosphoglycolate phosphatase
MPKISEKLALFDLDGTLIDTVPDICAAINSALKAARIEPISELAARAYIGEGSVTLVHRSITKNIDGQATEACFSQVYNDFGKNYGQNLFVNSAIYPGARQSLDELKSVGFKLGCITNKPYGYALPLLKKAGLAHLFDIILGGDSLKEKKPNPLPIFNAIQQTKSTRERTVMIGDSITDLRAAKNAEVYSICVSYGYHGGVDLKQHNPTLLIDSLDSLPLLIQNLYSNPHKKTVSELT